MRSVEEMNKGVKEMRWVKGVHFKPNKQGGRWAAAWHAGQKMRALTFSVAVHGLLNAKRLAAEVHSTVRAQLKDAEAAGTPFSVEKLESAIDVQRKKYEIPLEGMDFDSESGDWIAGKRKQIQPGSAGCEVQEGLGEGGTPSRSKSSTGTESGEGRCFVFVHVCFHATWVVRLRCLHACVPVVIWVNARIMVLFGRHRRRRRHRGCCW
jgi:hypothetical protein